MVSKESEMHVDLQQESNTELQRKNEIKEGSQLLSQLRVVQPVVERQSEILQKHAEFSAMVEAASAQKGSCFKPNREAQKYETSEDNACGSDNNIIESQFYNPNLLMDYYERDGLQYYNVPTYGNQYTERYNSSQMPHYNTGTGETSKFQQDGLQYYNVPTYWNQYTERYDSSQMPHYNTGTGETSKFQQDGPQYCNVPAHWNQHIERYDSSQMPHYSTGTEETKEFQQEKYAEQNDLNECDNSIISNDSAKDEGHNKKKKNITPDIQEKMIVIPNHFDSFETHADTKITTTPSGLISVTITGALELLMSIDGAIAFRNLVHNLTVCLKKNERAVAYEHPGGFMYSGPRDTLFVGFHHTGEHREVKMTDKEILFRKNKSRLMYCLDSSGTRICYRRLDIRFPRDFMESYFFGSAKYGPQCISAAQNIIDTTFRFWQDDEDDELYFIVGKVMVSMSKDGNVRVQKILKQDWVLEASLRSSNLTYRKRRILELTSSVGGNPHMYLRLREKSVHYDGKTLVTAAGSQSSKINECGEISSHG